MGTEALASKSELLKSWQWNLHHKAKGYYHYLCTHLQPDPKQKAIAPFPAIDSNTSKSK
jgi:hypothetical protein